MKKLHERILDKMRHYGRETWYFLSSTIFLKNFVKMVAVLVGIFILTSWWMRCYTNHGESVQVPSYVGMSLDDALKKISAKGFRYVLSDSVFIVDKNPGEIIDQNPKPLSRVKENRTIYLTITKQTPDEVSLPDLVGNYDFDQYAKKLSLLGITARVKERIFNNKLEESTILYFYYNDEKITEAELGQGIKIPMGSTLNFVISTRTGGTVDTPDLICLKYSEAEFIITASNLNIGSINEDNSVYDRANAYVWKQTPGYVPGTQMRIGEQVTLYLTQEPPQGCGE